MARQRRIDFDGAVHHVMNRGVNHEPIFFGDPDRIEFGRRLADIHERFGVTTLAYCLMDNHYHLLLRTPEGDLSAAMHRLASLYSRHTNDRIGRDGPLFRSRFHSILVTTDAYLLAATRYIHRNALDLPGVASIDAYRWSSYRSYVGERRTPTFVQTDLVLGCFGGDRSAFAAFHVDGNAAASSHPVGLADVMQLVEFVITEDQLLHDGEATPIPGLQRTVMLLLVNDHPSAEWHDDLEARCSFASATARRMALHRARQRRTTDPAVARIAAKVQSLILATRPLNA
jgi:REP element-mobilizing transposase RayT